MSIGANIVMRPQNAASASIIRFVPHFVALRLSWTHNSLKSEGMEQFVEEFLPTIRSVNVDILFYSSYIFMRLAIFLCESGATFRVTPRSVFSR